jgi:cytoskeleton protein RodZ
MNRNRPQDRDRVPQRPAASVLPQGSLGAWLRTQREARGVSLREIADSSKISLRYLEALELDRFDVLPAPVFTRGFLKEYARVVGLDADEVVNLYLLAADESAPELPQDEPTVARRAGGPSPLGYGLLLTVAVVLFLGVAALLSWWAQRRGREEPRPDAPPPAAASAVAAAPPATLPAPTAAPPAPASAVPSAAETQAAGVPSPAPSTPAPMHVVLEFSDDCWVETVVDGQRRSSELRTSGEVVSLEVASAVLLTLGNVPAVRIEVDGRPFPLPSGSTHVVRDLRIDRDAVARLAGTGPSTP